MAIKLPDGLEISSSAAVDSRLVLTKEQMKAMSKSNMPTAYFCICSDDKKFYLYDKSIAVADLDPELGRFRPLENYLNFKTEEAKANLDEAITAAITESQDVKDAIEEVVKSGIEVDGGLIVDEEEDDNLDGGEII